MKLFDPHIHMTSRTTDDYQAMAAAGIAALVEPAFWVGQPRTHVGTFEDYFLSLLGWERFRASQFGIRHYCTIAMNPREANDAALVSDVLALLPRYLEKDGVVAVGEIGYDDMTPAEDRCLAAQLELAKAHRLWHERRPTLALVYLPHLDYVLQRQGPRGRDVPAELRAIDAVCGELIEIARKDGSHVIVVSEYGITEVDGAIHINRVLREAGTVEVRTELGRELLDPGASAAFAVADHQIAHVYVRDPERIPELQQLLARVPGIERVVHGRDRAALGLDHPRSGEIIAVSAADKWFSYYYWTDDDRAPDFARTVEIHRKPGYDPVELFVDPAIRAPRATIAWKLARRAMGFRTLLDVIPLDTSLVRGSHGRLTDRPECGPLVISSAGELVPPSIRATDVKQLVLDHVFAP